MKLSVGIITYNEEQIIARTIDSVKNIADEIVIIDSNSTDKTVEIAKLKGAKVITQSWLGYGKQKNFMIDNCSGEWILSIDADEIISEELAVEISEEIKKENNTVEVYELREKVVCFGKLIKHGGFSGRYKTKLFKKCEDRFSDLEVHEYYETNKATAKLKEYYYHYSFDSLEQYIEKTNKYSTLSAIDNKNKGKKFNLIRFFLDPGFKFIQKYIFKLGILDGVEGFLLASIDMQYSLLKQYKLKKLGDKENLVK
ncbi:MAG: glycosyltransferase family 2 protein [Leptotrichiaceae bacterium]